jgi:CubicO group peptidase (beta-lactamase class C family)
MDTRIICLVRSVVLPAVLLAMVVSTARAVEEAESLDLSDLLLPILAKHDLPGMVAAIVQSDGVAATGAAGLRQRGSETAISIGDKFHIGSCTKAMTATLIACLVQEGRMRWETTVGEVFDDVANMHQDWRLVTIEQLLCNCGGAPASLVAGGLWGRLWNHEGTPTEQRRTLVMGVITKRPQAEPGATYIYSNAGFAIAGAMAEKITGESWEDLMRSRLFEPLGMRSAGFGAPGDADQINQPRGHRPDGKPVPPGRGADNPSAIGPAGTVHCSIGDWSRFIALHLRGARGEIGLILPPESFTKLHTPYPAATKQDYAMGWANLTRGWAKGDGGSGRTLTHNGSNTMWFSVAWLAPERDFAVLIACNQGGDKAAKACDQAASAVIQRWLSRD